MEKDILKDGYIKFNCNFDKLEIDISREIFFGLNYWRNILYRKGWIGSYPDGIGFGNISVRIPGSDKFYITGSATGNLSALESKHYVIVEYCDPGKNTIRCRGLLPASSESMSHYIIYNTIPLADAVVHIHNRQLWDKFTDRLPTTAKEVSYGTPEMAYELQRILRLPETANKSVVVMGGHEEGIISYGISLEEAVKVMVDLED